MQVTSFSRRGIGFGFGCIVSLISLALTAEAMFPPTRATQSATPTQFVNRIYLAALARTPDPSGLEWAANHFAQNGCGSASLKSWGRAVYLSTEYNERGYSNTAKVETLYRGILNRESDASGRVAYVGQLNNGRPFAEVVDDIFNSTEFAQLVPALCASQRNVTFDDSAPDRLRLSSPAYELSLSKTHGGILGILDRATNTNLTLGSRNGCLWGSVNAAGQYAGGCSYASNQPYRFRYEWNAAAGTLTLRYDWEPGTAERVDATVVITPSDARHFDLQLTIVNNRGRLEDVFFPSDLLFQDQQTQAGYLPLSLPGVRLNPGFFAQNRSYLLGFSQYPAPMFADYFSVDHAGGHLAVYAVNPAPNPLAPVVFGPLDREAGTWCLYRSFNVRQAAGTTWRSPLMRIQVGGSFEQTMRAYRNDNQIASYPLLRDKVDAARWQKLVNAPLLKVDVEMLDRPFNQYAALLNNVPTPQLVQIVGFPPNGFDRNYPDYLPPDPRWGTTADLRAVIATLQARGHLVMPFCNVSWWMDDAPTVRNLPPPLTLRSIAALNEQGQPIYEEYINGAQGLKRGFVTSPFVPFVRERMAAALNQFRAELQPDFLFEDQLGARPWMFDYNPAAPTIRSYMDGWEAHTAQFADHRLMTEGGFDRLARTEVGFHASLYTTSNFYELDQRLGAGNWRPWPLATYLTHDKTLPYQHNLALGDERDAAKATITFDLAFGMMLSYGWQGRDYNPATDRRLDWMSDLQRAVAARYAGKELTSFTLLNNDVTRTVFDDVNIIANWSTSQSYAAQGHQIAPQGFLATTNDGAVLAGIFSGSFNGQSLSAGDHHLIVERPGAALIVRHPLGNDTSLSLTAPNAVRRVTAFNRNRTAISNVPFRLQNGRVTFACKQTLNGQAVATYELR